MEEGLHAKGCPFLANSETAGGRPWTKEWLKCDNSYLVDMVKADPECVAFPPTGSS